MTKHVGEVHHDWEILSYHNRLNVTARSISNGYIAENVQMGHLRRNLVKNPYNKSVYGIGYVGVGETPTTENGRSTRVYRLWSDMLRRCYSGESKYPTYSDCSVDESWHCFQTFASDIKSIEGYELWLKDHNYQLDKDVKVEGNRLYSKDTCMFITFQENQSARKFRV